MIPNIHSITIYISEELLIQSVQAENEAYDIDQSNENENAGQSLFSRF